MEFDFLQLLFSHATELGVVGVLTVIILYREFVNSKEKAKLHEMYQNRIDKVFDKSIESQTNMVSILNEVKTGMQTLTELIILALNEKNDK